MRFFFGGAGGGVGALAAGVMENGDCVGVRGAAAGGTSVAVPKPALGAAGRTGSYVGGATGGRYGASAKLPVEVAARGGATGGGGGGGDVGTGG